MAGLTGAYSRLLYAGSMSGDIAPKRISTSAKRQLPYLSVVLVVERGREPLAVPCECEQRNTVWRERDCHVAECHSDGGV